jgi:hypothetical protein
MKNSMSPEDFNSWACDIANDYAQARQEMGPDDYESWEVYSRRRLQQHEEPDTSGPVHSNKDAICCYCGSNKEPNVDYDVQKEDYVFAGTYSDCECRSIVNDSLECTRTSDDEDDDLPF